MGWGKRIKLACIFAFCLFLGFAAEIDKPNIILILADDMGMGDISHINGGKTNTPNIDVLIKNGLWFTQAYSGAPVCAPARASLLTGMSPHRTGCVTLNMKSYPDLTRIKRSLSTMADVFQANGYVTGLIGKWHCGDGENYRPTDRGFQEFEGFYGYQIPSYFNYQLTIQEAAVNVENNYLTDDLSNRAVEFIKRHCNEPFFLHLAHYAPHRPLGAPQKLINKYLSEGLDTNTATIYAMIERMDQGIGKLIDALERLGLQEKTLIIFTSDNGPDPLVGERFNLGLKGSKYMVSEGGIRVPFVVSWPEKIKPGILDDIIHFTDIFPSLVDLCALDLSIPQKFDGGSFAGLLFGEQGKLPDERFWQWNRGVPFYSYNAAIRQGDWKLVRPFVSHWEIPLQPSDLKPVLYNLRADPYETENVSAKHKALFDELNVKLEQWSRQVEHDRLEE